MSRIPDDELQGLLRDGLRRAPVPVPGADFDSRVRAGLRREPPMWQRGWSALRLAFAPAAGALAVTLGFLILTAPSHPTQTAAPVALDRRADRQGSIEHDLDRIDRDTPSLCGFQPRQPDMSSRAPKHEPRGAFRRRQPSASEAEA